MKNAPEIHQLKTDLALCKQGGLEVVEFYSKLIGMWCELENHVRMPHCTCGKCDCGIQGNIMKIVDEEKTHQF